MADQGSEGLLSPFLRRQRIKAASPFISGKVLDVGCGSGMLAGAVSPQDYTGVDQDEYSINLARQQFPKHRFQLVLPTESEAFNSIFALAVIEHVPDPVLFLRELTARLDPSPESCIILTTPHPMSGWIQSAGSFLGIFSQHAHEEHKKLFNHSDFLFFADECGLCLVKYSRFLFGVNQLAVLRRIK